ncbi:RNA recognition motif(a.k.aRRM RBD or RNP domain) [Lotmaria passim]
MKKFRSGNSGPYTAEYHALLGATPWIMVRRLLSHAQSEDDGTPQLSEGDVATVFSQFGDVVDVRFVRHRKTGRFLGTAFVKFRDYRSGILASDELNSDFEKGELFFLSASQEVAASGSDAKGITVERCEEAVIPALYSADVETYPQWLSRHHVAPN